MRKILVFLLIALCFPAAAQNNSTTAPQSKIYITHVTVINTDTGEEATDQTVVEAHGGPPSLMKDTGLRNTAEDVTTEITRLENELADAVVRRDFDALRRIEAEQYVYTDSDAKVSTRDDFIRDYAMGRSRVDSLRFHDMVVTSVGDTAVVRGILSVERTDNGRLTSRSTRYTRVYVRLPSGWQAIVGHSSELKQQTTHEESARAPANLQEIPDPARAIEEVRMEDEVRRVAMLHADVSALDNLLADDATIVWGDGTIDDKQSMLALFSSGRLRYSQFDYENTRVRLYGDTAVVTGQARVRLQSDGQVMAHHVHVTRVYVRDHDRWRLVASQTTRMPSE